MEKKELSDLNDNELLEEAKKRKLATITNALLVGFLIGIIFYSIWKDNLGFLTLIPLFIIFRLINNSKYDGRKLNSFLRIGI